MDSETFKERLKVAYETMRAYAYHVFTGLTSSEINWIPDNTKARTIQSYARHMMEYST